MDKWGVFGRVALASFAALPIASFAIFSSGCKGNSETQGKAASATVNATPSSNAQGNAPNAAYTVGMVLVGPWNDHGWNQAHFEGIKAAIDKIPNVKFEYGRQSESG